MRGSDFTYYRTLFASMSNMPSFAAKLEAAADLIEKNAALYRQAERDCGVPRALFGLTHYRECSCRPEGQILNGQSWKKVTTLVPAGLGPWASWDDAAEEAARRGGWTRFASWSVPLILTLLEKHNGGGYLRRGLHSPYIWAGTNHQQSGKYVADGKFDPSHWDTQLGCAPLYAEMLRRGVWKLTSGVAAGAR